MEKAVEKEWHWPNSADKGGWTKDKMQKPLFNTVTLGGRNNLARIGVGIWAGIIGYSIYKKVKPVPFPEIQSKDSLVAKHVTKEKWSKLSKINLDKFNLGKAIACAVQFPDQHCGIYAGNASDYVDFADVFNPIINEYHNLPEDFEKHPTDLDVDKIVGTIDPNAPVHSTRIRVGRNLSAFPLSPAIGKNERTYLEYLAGLTFPKLTGDLVGKYFPLEGMSEKDRKQLVDDHFLFVSGDKNLEAAGMERDWPGGRGIFHNTDKTFLVWVNEEDQFRIISMQKGGDFKAVFERLFRGVKEFGDILDKDFDCQWAHDKRLGYIHSCPTNVGTGMRASVHIDLPGWTKAGLPALKARCEELGLQPRGTRGESGGQTGVTYDISNKHRLGYSEVQLAQTMIDGVNTLYKEDLELQKK